MFTRFQLYFLVGCLAVTGILLVAYESRHRSQNSSPSPPAPITAEKPETASRTTMTNPGAVRPETPLPVFYFDLTAKSHTDVIQAAGEQKIDADLELKYTRDKTNGGVVLTLYSMGMAMSQDGTFVESSLITRDKFVQQVGRQKRELSFEQLPPEQQQMSLATFATNLCKISLDADQNELGREILSEAGFAMLQEGNLNTLQLMHGPYHRDKDRWQGIKRIPMTRGIVLDCPVEYTRATSDGNEINISGSLSKDEVDSPQADVAVGNVSCTLSGKEIFDPAKTEFTSGEATLEYSFEVLQKGVKTATLHGRISLSLHSVTSNGK